MQLTRRWILILLGVSLPFWGCASSSALYQRLPWLPRTIHVSVFGQVRTELTHEPLPGISVLIAGTPLKAVTDNAGNYRIDRLPMGAYQIVLLAPDSTELVRRFNIIEPGDRLLNIEVPEKWPAEPADELAGIEKTAPDPLDRKSLRLFENIIIGSRGKCRLLNPSALHAHTEKRRSGKWTRFSASRPLQIENLELGYRLLVLLEKAQVSETKRGFNMSYDAVTWFDELLPVNEKQARRWRKNRRQTYNGSLRHFLASLAAGRLNQEGFMVAAPREGAWGVGSPGVPGFRSGPAPRFLPKHDPYFIAYATRNDDVFVLDFPDVIQVIYLREPVETKYRKFRGVSNDAQTSMISLLQGRTAFDRNGNQLDFAPITTAGYWAVRQLSDLFPLTYSPNLDLP